MEDLAAAVWLWEASLTAKARASGTGAGFGGLLRASVPPEVLERVRGWGDRQAILARQLRAAYAGGGAGPGEGEEGAPPSPGLETRPGGWEAGAEGSPGGRGRMVTPELFLGGREEGEEERPHER